MKCPECETGLQDGARECGCGWRQGNLTSGRSLPGQAQGGGRPFTCDDCIHMGVEDPYLIKSPEDHLRHRAEAHRTLMFAGEEIPWAGPGGRLVPEARPANREKEHAA